jgi:cellulose synthase/poly-beta-1,6-N-acetylglucosamine synthase-like glycosyltransferase
VALLRDISLAGEWLLVLGVMLGVVPLLVASYQFLLVALHTHVNHYGKVGNHLPRTAILIPAWNEAAVIGASIDRLMLLDYPRESLKICVVDDASTDATPDVIRAKVAQYPGNVVHMRRETGGEGKAHTLNHGLAILLEDEWMEALLIMDADVIYEPSSLKKMTRHLADPDVGAVTAYIKEGSRPGNYMTRFIGYEYITAQAAARRSQNVLGVVACLAGGAQLHSRANIEAIGGRIDTSSLAEDTFTTFKTQLEGRKVVFEPHAIVWAEEPGSVGSLWKQRLRWARGNVQVTSQFRHLWFRPSRQHRLGSFSFGLIWFCLFLLPLIMIEASACLVALFFINFPLSWHTFNLLWIVNGLSYIFITCFTVLIDPKTGRHAWREAIMFPGAISVFVILYACFPRPTRWVIHTTTHLVGIDLTGREVRYAILFAYIWMGASMAAAWLAKYFEDKRFGTFLTPLVVYVVGYGPLLCAITFTSYVKELRRAEMKWEKTEKTGKVAIGT